MNPLLLDPNREPNDIEIQVEVFRRLEFAVRNEIVELEQALQGRPVNAVAWVSRNLLELLVWIYYCIDSPENAKQLHTDAALDVLDVLRRIPQGKFASDPQYSFQQDRLDFIAKAKAEGLDLTGSYTAITNAAEKLGRKEFLPSLTRSCQSLLILPPFG